MLIIALVIFTVDLGLAKGWAAIPAFFALVAMLHPKR